MRPAAVAAVQPSAGARCPARPRPSAGVALARWIADPANPLPARVMVNRVWHYHFGRGIVATPSDFGFNGAPPSHPELLDWLASTYIAGGWRLKPIHRLIVTLGRPIASRAGSTRRRRPSIATTACSGG